MVPIKNALECNNLQNFKEIKFDNYLLKNYYI